MDECEYDDDCGEYIKDYHSHLKFLEDVIDYEAVCEKKFMQITLCEAIEFDMDIITGIYLTKDIIYNTYLGIGDIKYSHSEIYSPREHIVDLQIRGTISNGLSSCYCDEPRPLFEKESIILDDKEFLFTLPIQPYYPCVGYDRIMITPFHHVNDKVECFIEGVKFINDEHRETFALGCTYARGLNCYYSFDEDDSELMTSIIGWDNAIFWSNLFTDELKVNWHLDKLYQSTLQL